jgi:hypothetical protein
MSVKWAGPLLEGFILALNVGLCIKIIVKCFWVWMDQDITWRMGLEHYDKNKAACTTFRLHSCKAINQTKCSLYLCCEISKYQWQAAEFVFCPQYGWFTCQYKIESRSELLRSNNIKIQKFKCIHQAEKSKEYEFELLSHTLPHYLHITFTAVSVTYIEKSTDWFPHIWVFLDAFQNSHRKFSFLFVSMYFNL